jgi:hypothetical protein
MKIQLIGEAKDELHGWFKAIPDFYTISFDNKIIPKLSFNTNVNKMLASVDNDNREIDPIIDDGPLGGLRGVPIDASEVYIKLVKQWEGKGQYHHFYYLKELDNVKRQGYLKKKDNFGITYEELASDFLIFLDQLNQLAEERNICFYCIRISFFFVE